MNTPNKNNKRNWIKYTVLAIVIVALLVVGWSNKATDPAKDRLSDTSVSTSHTDETTTVDRSNSEENVRHLAAADFNFNLRDSENQMISLEEFRGKVIFINLWATWCPPCIAELPSIDKLHQDMGDDVVFVMVSLDRNFNISKKFMKNKGYNLPIYAPANNLPAMYQTSAIPTTYIIDAKGDLALTHEGMADYSDPKFKEFLNSLK